jgi:predicted CoA-binding protein
VVKRLLTIFTVEKIFYQMKDNKIKTDAIEKFLSHKEIAVAGISRNKKKFGYKVLELLHSKDYQVHPIHPEASEIEGVRCYQSPSEVPSHVRHLFVVTPANASDRLMTEAVARGFDMIWIQQKSETDVSVQMVKDKGIELIKNCCIFMFLEPKGGHAFHRFFLKLFGRL